MNRILSYFIYLFVAAAGAGALSSCEDQIDYPDGPIKEGISTVDVEVGFKAFTPALESRASGTAMRNINSLWVVIYDKRGNFIEKREITGFESVLDKNTRPDGQISSETQTGCAKFKMTITNGYYKMYVVANHDLSKVPDTDIDEISELKALDLKWQDGDVTQNAQMFGWFVNGNRETDHGTDAPVITIRDNSSAVHAWVRRAASKVTVAFNTNKLSEYVSIYLKSVTIKDIPTHCYLNDENAPGDQNYTLSSELVDGETIYFKGAKPEHNNPKADHKNWPRIQSGDSIFGLYSDENGKPDAGTPITQRLEKEHSPEARALYFYENMQGEGILGTESDKRQDVTGNNKQVSFADGVNEGTTAWKDAKPFGSYIEVKGYYENNGPTSPGQGEITYRFMLGKDHIKDYDAERNYHYKLTMSFNGNANDIDFHIDYKEEARPGFHVQDTTYVSYLYNQPSHTVVRATPKNGYELLSLEAYILDNEWRPHAAEGEDLDALDIYNKRAWDDQASLGKQYPRTTDGYTRPHYVAEWTDIDGETHSDESAKNTEFGFLSLRKVTTQIYELQGVKDKMPFVARMRKLYFLGDKNGTGDSKDKSRGYRNYGTMPSSDGTFTVDPSDVDGKFDISRQTNPRTKNIDYVMEVPLFTRAMSIDSWAVYSGANPFYRHHRYARVRFIATYKKTDTKVSGPAKYQESDETIVLQARRIDNPRIIYRRASNQDPFLVTLCYNKLTAAEQTYGTVKDTDVIYEPIISRGPWTATIEKDPHGIVSISANGRVAVGENHSITGRNHTPIQFTYKPRKKSPADDSYGAIITVRYHGNSCTHKIIVRQGYAAHTIGSGKAIWSAFNVYDQDELTVNPLSVGSTFRRYKDLSYPISVMNNKKYGVDEAVPSTYAFEILGQESTVWGDIPANDTGAEAAFTTMNLYNFETEKSMDYRLPDKSELPDIGIYTVKDNEPTDLTEISKVQDIGNAFGVAYADGATKTLFTKAAYSFYDPDNTITDTESGCRGVAIYSVSTGDNVFFSFGAWGNPRRRRDGLLQYGSIDFKLNRDNASDDYRPLAYDLRTQIGGCYWITTTDDSHVAIDFNGGNYMSSYLNHNDVFQTNSLADAMTIKPIRIK